MHDVEGLGCGRIVLRIGQVATLAGFEVAAFETMKPQLGIVVCRRRLKVPVNALVARNAGRIADSPSAIAHPEADGRGDGGADARLDGDIAYHALKHLATVEDRLHVEVALIGVALGDDLPRAHGHLDIAGVDAFAGHVVNPVAHLPDEAHAPPHRLGLCRDGEHQQTKAAYGSVDAVGTEEEILGEIRTLVSMLPSNNEDEAVADCTDDLNRACENIAGGYADPAIVLSDVADDGLFFETKRECAPEMATGFIRLGGTTVGAVANRSVSYDENGEEKASYETVLTASGCYKAADFVRFCDAFEIPVITLTNVTGFAATESEETKVNVIVKKAVGSAYAVMNSKATGADFTIAFPDATIGMMDARLAAHVLCTGSAEEVAETAARYDALQNNIDSAAARGYVDQIIEPEDLRKYLIGAMEVLYTKREEFPAKKHSAK